jgi:hypothetical protein
VYPFGIGILLFTLTMLGLFGWDVALTIGSPIAGLVVAVFTGALYWLTPRLPWLNPIGVHTVGSQGQISRLDSIYRALWNLYRQLGRLSASFVSTLEGDGGILWALLFLVLFISILAPRLP